MLGIPSPMDDVPRIDDAMTERGGGVTCKQAPGFEEYGK